ncbi:MAG: grasp-with-spasm system SPASM domain peptide maturase [Candidatus Azobacteroides sp.]|nr:grasp-with-spasm system SPASM domain peptide maturase [Candidatus Azobacteroides sp.]
MSPCILLKNNLLDISKIQKEYNNADQKIIDDYIDFLNTNELVFLCKKAIAKYFKNIDIKYESPYLINNVVIELDINSHYDLPQFFEDIEHVGCIDLQIKIFDEQTVNRISDILSYTLNKRIKAIELIIPYTKSFVVQKNIFSLLRDHLRITAIVIYNTPQEHINHLEKQFLNDFSKIGFYSDMINNSQYCGFVSPAYFTVNLPFFMESKLYNNCLNKKLTIDNQGNIKNCTALNKSYGNLKNDNLIQIISSSEFQKLWKIKKDEISVCRDCEFRYMCSDCRAFTENNDLYGKPKYCHYDPYEMKWDNL